VTTLTIRRLDRRTRTGYTLQRDCNIACHLVVYGKLLSLNCYIIYEYLTADRERTVAQVVQRISEMFDDLINISAMNIGIDVERSDMRA